MNIDELRSEIVRLVLINKPQGNLIESVIQKINIKIRRDIQNLFSGISKIKQKLINNHSSEHKLLSELTTNKLNREDVTSGGINLLLLSILIMICASILKNVALSFISIFLSGSFGIKEQGTVIPLID